MTVKAAKMKIHFKKLFLHAFFDRMQGRGFVFRECVGGEGTIGVGTFSNRTRGFSFRGDERTFYNRSTEGVDFPTGEGEVDYREILVFNTFTCDYQVPNSPKYVLLPNRGNRGGVSPKIL